MYQYEDFDKDFLADRVAEFRAQVQRRIDGVLSEDEFKPLRLQNGLYLQLHAYMLRVDPLRLFARNARCTIAERWDKAMAILPRGNIQFNWVKLQDVGDILEALGVDMHAIQTSGNCIGM